jgi:chemotaxis regulatin CheY-phosphate phosphatase CheZ
VTHLVKSVERALIDLLRAAGGAVSTRPAVGASPAAAEQPAGGILHGPAVTGVTPAAVSQDDADALLAELGF